MAELNGFLAAFTPTFSATTTGRTHCPRREKHVLFHAMRIPVLPEGEEAEVGEDCDDDGGGAVEADGGADDARDDHAQRQRDEPHAPRHQVRVVGERLQIN